MLVGPILGRSICPGGAGALYDLETQSHEPKPCQSIPTLYTGAHTGRERGACVRIGGSGPSGLIDRSIGAGRQSQMASSVRLPVASIAARPSIHRPVMPAAVAQGRYWVRPQAPVAAATAPYSIPPAAASPAQPAPPGTTWERDEVSKAHLVHTAHLSSHFDRSPLIIVRHPKQVWRHEERLYATALSVAGLVFQGEEEQEGAAGRLQAKVCRFFKYTYLPLYVALIG